MKARPALPYVAPEDTTEPTFGKRNRVVLGELSYDRHMPAYLPSPLCSQEALAVSGETRAVIL